jgi:hypothetical protein
MILNFENKVSSQNYSDLNSLEEEILSPFRKGEIMSDD